MIKISKNIRRNLFLTLIFILPFVNYAQPQNFGNEWINYNQKYFSFPITENGFYRINYNTLNAALQSQGISLNNINPRNFQIFARGEEQAIYITNENTGLFTPGDYIEFYAKKNDAWLDVLMFDNPTDLVNHDYSLISDTARYYFTYNNNLNNKRIQIETDTNYSNYPPQPYFFYNSEVYYTNVFMDGEAIYNDNNGSVFDPEYNKGEGFYDSPFYLAGSKTKQIPTPNVYQSGPNAQISFDVLGASNYLGLPVGSPNHHLRVEFANQVFDTLFIGYKLISASFSVAPNNLSYTNTNFTFSSVDDIGSGADRNAISNVKIKYPHTPNLNNQSEYYIEIPASSNKLHYDFSNFSGGSNPVFYDLRNDRKITISQNNNTFKVLLAASVVSRECYITSSNNIKNVSSLKAVSQNAEFIDLLQLNPNANYFIITSPDFLSSNGNLSSAADYTNYRISTGYNVMLVNVEDLYHQYSYGIRKHPLSIRNFMRRVQQNFTHELEGLFLIGKAYKYNETRKNAQLYNDIKVPTMGHPPSDILLTAGLLDNFYQPLLPTGRLSAINLDHIDLYLEKVITYESELLNPAADWKKNVLHFGGGTSDSEQAAIRNYLGNYEAIISAPFPGANVSSIFKTTSDPIQMSLSDFIKQKINTGVSLMTFFGHASGVGFDISIDHPSAYNNYGKYPLMLANSCYSGDIYMNAAGSVASSSEQFVLIRDKGVIAYIAQVTSGRRSRLNIYSDRFYNHISNLDYGKSIGYAMKETIKAVQSSYALTKELCYEVNLHGDPAIRFFVGDAPDYIIDNQSVFYNPEEVSSELDSFSVNIIIKNIAKAYDTTIVVEIQRTFPNGEKDVVRGFAIDAPYFIDTLEIRYPVDNVKGLGLNTFSVTIDATNMINELNESNNSANYFLDIKAADVIPLMPDEYSIVPGPDLNIVVSTVDPFSKLNNYYFEIDTNINFNSPIADKKIIQSKGGLIDWKPNISLIDSSVYYWRVSLDSTVAGEFNWRNSSFQYIQNAEGWSQADFYQFINNEFQLVNPNENSRIYEFVNDVKDLDVYNGIPPALGWADIQYTINGVQYAYWPCFSNGLRFAVFDTISAEPWVSFNDGNNIGPYMNFHCRGRDINAFDFPTETMDINGVTITDSMWFSRIAKFIAQIPDGTPVMIMSVGNSYVDNYPEYLYKAIDSIGSNFIRSIQNNRPFILFGKKGDLNNANEVIGQSSNSTIQFSGNLLTNWTYGKIVSPIFGPAKKWNSLNWKQYALNYINTDSVRLQIEGIKTDGSVDILLQGISPDTSSIPDLSNYVNAQDYPYLKLNLNMADDSLRTAAQIENWIIKASQAPEFAFAPKHTFEFYKDTINEGDSIEMKIAIKNLSNVDGDSLLIKYWIVDSENKLFKENYKRIQPIYANSVVVDTIKMTTKGLNGLCILHFEINPLSNSKFYKYDQIEISHLNNKAYKRFFVKKDKENPLLDVTFDGMRILDGDIVSAKPQIIISLKDENKFLSLNDTSLFEIRLIKPSSSSYERLYFNDPRNNMDFEEANLPDNNARVVYRPEFIEDGTYKLSISARDISNNDSGNDNYEINFEVINKSTITEVLNWPNPFTTKTHFVFTLTGSELPSDMKIQIMTISGKLVREITMDELGPIRIGKNITDYAWDGTDEYGDRLANGVYLYRVISLMDGKNIELRDTQASQYFNKSFGKMYLMR